ncbi:MAG: ATP-binding protein [Cyanobacteria bacterium P01_F01_bin.150]
MFNLRRYFSVASLTAFAVAIPAMGFFSYQRAMESLIDIVKQRNELLTETLGNSLWIEHADFLSSAYLLNDRDLRFSSGMFDLRETIFDATQGLPVIKIRIFSLSGRILYSTVPDQIGSDGAGSEGFQVALDGQAFSLFHHGQVLYKDVPLLKNHRLVSSYVPIQLDGTEGTTSVIIELYTDVTPAVDKVKQSQLTLITGLVAICGLLYGTLFVIISRADRILKSQNRELESTKESLAQANHSLESQVLDRTAALRTTNEQLKQTLDELTQAQEQLIHNEKMSSLGQLIAGIAHEVNTPLGAIASSAGSVSKFLTQMVDHVPEVMQRLSAREGLHFMAVLRLALGKSPLRSTKEERKLRRSFIKILEQESIADSATIADTLVDIGLDTENVAIALPLLRLPDSQCLLETIYKLSSIKRGVTTIEVASERASKVMFALKSYSRYNHTAEPVTVNILDGIETTLTLYHHQIKRGVDVKREFDPLPLVQCYADELAQVWTNLIHNALQAMSHHGTLTIAACPISLATLDSPIPKNIKNTGKASDQGVQISITDTGTGIPDEIQHRIFAPFFTTKAMGEGSGLGLDIVKKIIQKHHGHITVASKPGQTTFTVTLPILHDIEASHSEGLFASKPEEYLIDKSVPNPKLAPH